MNPDPDRRPIIIIRRVDNGWTAHCTSEAHGVRDGQDQTFVFEDINDLAEWLRGLPYAGEEAT